MSLENGAKKLGVARGGTVSHFTANVRTMVLQERVIVSVPNCTNTHKYEKNSRGLVLFCMPGLGRGYGTPFPTHPQTHLYNHWLCP